MSSPPPILGTGQAPPDGAAALPPEPQQELDDESEDTWAPSSWDLRQGLDVAELDELPAEWPGTHPR